MIFFEYYDTFVELMYFNTLSYDYDNAIRCEHQKYVFFEVYFLP